MKLTREQVSQLSDVELNRGMYDHYWVVNSGEPFDEFFNTIVGSEDLNYLTDYNLTMPLAFSSGIGIKPPNYMNPIFTAYQDYIIPDVGCRSRSAYNINPLRAICEVLLMIAINKVDQ